ncbi:Rrf2 family transcriptional regulator [Acetobacter estunensis]|uniref:Rrf2 family transcriptional regulator n=1 Tax=Acetobacter estunensis TaxID=104097 RepID=UPI001C2D41F6|nr:Rrf2 family transcriptional regulator [Acetobacter estunensis]MBV1837152.1 Rrf2 family transcriptional regulator [Acetobacter estunensis]
MQLTLHTDYALRTLVFLACNPERLASIREIAEVYGISENHLIKIIHRLGQGGFIETIRGRNGGLRLGRPSEDIRLGDVVRYTEEELGLVVCMQTAKEKGSTCRLMPNCRLRGVLGTALSAFMNVLDQTTLADVVSSDEWQALHASPITP